MNKANEEIRHETFESGGYVVTRGCVYRPELSRWEPQVSIKVSRDPGAAPVVLAAKAEHFQDTPEDAYLVALTMANTWLNENPRNDGTVDAAA